jgi:hypothetical protein
VSRQQKATLYGYWGYPLLATDGELGHVEDFRVDDRDWSLREVVIDTRNWLPGRHVRVSADALDGVDWNERAINVRLSRQQIEACPEVEA